MRATRLLAVLLATAACGGPPKALEVEMKKPYLDLTYGKQEQLDPLTRAPGSDIGPSTAPGLIAAPVLLDMRPRGGSGSGSGGFGSSGQVGIIDGEGNQGPGLPNAVCERGDLFDPAVGDAPTVVSGPPKPGLYRYARSGWVKSEAIVNDVQYKKFASWSQRELSSTVTREVKDVTTVESPGRPPSFEYKVVQSEPGPDNTVLRTTTTYLIDPGTGGGTEQDPGGLYIRQIITERADLKGQGPTDTPLFTKGVETFNAEPPVKLLDMPIRPQAFDPDRQSVGVDPLTGAQLKVVRQTARRERFDACGRVIDVWRVELFLTSEYANAGSYDTTRHPRGHRISGRFYFAPQLGGLIVFDDMLFGLDGNNSYKAVIPGRDGSNWFVQKSVASLLNLDPEPVR